MAADPVTVRPPVPWRELLRYLGLAYRLRHRAPPRLTLPPAAARTAPPAVAIAAFRRILSAVRLLTFWNLKVCFYRSFAAAMAGRQLGLNVQMHLGVQSPGGKHCRAHSWISLRGVVLGESRPPRTIYPVLLGRTGDIVYWMAAPATAKDRTVPAVSVPPAADARRETG